ncbi:MAG TPA: nucleotide exchange factor GrpE [Myxococcales bacterium]|nr:nucleotide exchange factor GrpE [Myxococcales bacterium]HAN32206.1 nucleotide exchange factor GrpE [Myxococcales bacterium]
MTKAQTQSSQEIEDHNASDESTESVEPLEDGKSVDDLKGEPDPEPVVELSPEQVRIEELESEVEALGETLRSYAERADRMRAEFEASKSRIEREHARNLQGDKVKAVTGLLGVLDSLDQALANAPSSEPAFVDGMNLIRQEFETALSGLGLSRFDPSGELFDPERHEALTVMAVPDESQNNRVVHVMKQGALVGEKVVRAASVVVGKHSSAS